MKYLTASGEVTDQQVSALIKILISNEVAATEIVAGIHKLASIGESAIPQVLDALEMSHSKAYPPMENLTSYHFSGVYVRIKRTLARMGKPAIDPLISMFFKSESGRDAALDCLNDIIKKSDSIEMLEYTRDILKKHYILSRSNSLENKTRLKAAKLLLLINDQMNKLIEVMDISLEAKKFHPPSTFRPRPTYRMVK